MPLVVIEGPDGSGKTTLIRNLRQNSSVYFAIVAGAGPPPNTQIYSSYLAGVAEFAKRLAPRAVICDRYPAISEEIYGRILRGRSLALHDYLEDCAAVDVFVYCRPHLHTLLDTIESTEQMAGVRDHATHIVARYDEVFVHLSKHHRVIRYDYERDDYMALAKQLDLFDDVETTSSSNTFFDDVNVWHQKLNLPFTSPLFKPTLLSTKDFNFRVNCLFEELREFIEAHTAGDLAEAADALGDLVWFALGTAAYMGVPFNQVWAEIRRANGDKRPWREGDELKPRVYTAGEIVKPADWKPPDIAGVLDRYTSKPPL